MWCRSTVHTLCAPVSAGVKLTANGGDACACGPSMASNWLGCDMWGVSRTVEVRSTTSLWSQIVNWVFGSGMWRRTLLLRGLIRCVSPLPIDLN